MPPRYQMSIRPAESYLRWNRSTIIKYSILLISFIHYFWFFDISLTIDKMVMQVYKHIQAMYANGNYDLEIEEKHPLALVSYL